MSVKKVVILGAGPAGLSAGWKLAEKGIDVEMVELESKVGGLCRSLYKGDYTFDLGGHRFITNDEEVAMAYFPKTKIIEHAKRANLLSDKDNEIIEEGKEKMYVLGSSLKGEALKQYNNFRRFYALLPIFSAQSLRHLLYSRAFNYLRFIPNCFAVLLEFSTSLRKKHPRGIDFARYYILHLRKKLLKI